VEANRVFDELPGFLLRFALGVATLEGRDDGHEPAILVPLNDYGDSYVFMASSLESWQVYKIASQGLGDNVLAFADARESQRAGVP